MFVSNADCQLLQKANMIQVKKDQYRELCLSSVTGYDIYYFIDKLEV